jgi:5'-nucleotidase
MGDVIADAQLEATSAPSAGGAVAVFMNSGGVRADLPLASGTAGAENGKVTYGELFTVQPFGNNLVTMTLTGAQIKTLLEEQFRGCAESMATDNSTPSDDRFLQVSEGFDYTWSESGPACNKVDRASIKIDGAIISPSARYRVTLNNFLTDGDQYPVLKKGTDRLGGPQDIDALVSYFADHPSVYPPPSTRITLKP